MGSKKKAAKKKVVVAKKKVAKKVTKNKAAKKAKKAKKKVAKKKTVKKVNEVFNPDAPLTLGTDGAIDITTGGFLDDDLDGDSDDFN